MGVSVARSLVRPKRDVGRRGFVTGIVISALFAMPLPGNADQLLPDSRTMFPVKWDDNLRFAIDLSTRQLYLSATDDWHRVDFIGADLHKVFTGKSGDIGTLTLQGYFTHIKDEEIRPGWFDGEWEFVYRIFNFNYAVLPRGRLNFKIGHFEIPMGLEHPIDTNGTLRDYTHGQNIGVKADWGVSLNGILKGAEYEVSLSRGSGNSWETEGDPYIAAGRISTPSYRNLIWGFSAMSGDIFVHDSGGQTIEQRRVGVDMQWYVNQYGLLGELSVGEREGQPTSTSLIELNRTANSGSWMAYAQFVYRTRDPDDRAREDATTVHLGAKWDLSRWDLSVQLSRDVDSFDGISERNLYAAQARFRF